MSILLKTDISLDTQTNQINFQIANDKNQLTQNSLMKLKKNNPQTKEAKKPYNFWTISKKPATVCLVYIAPQLSRHKIPFRIVMKSLAL